MRVGVVGVGTISRAYLETLARLDDIRVVAVADLVAERAAAVDHPGVRALPVRDIFAADDVDLVLNLTIPDAHADVAQAAVAAGKHVYGEKPLATTTADARSVLSAAAQAGVRIGCAPDTVLGTGLQTARASLDAGDIGVPVAAMAFMVNSGPERWHPSPAFYYLRGGGPLMDMGPYYLTALVTMLGPVRRVVGMSATPQASRIIGSGPLAGTQFPVEVATHVAGVLEHDGGVLSTVVMSFDVHAGQLPRIEVYGSLGSLSVPDPNRFDGPVLLYRPEDPVWRPVPVSGGYPGAARGFGVLDMARAIGEGTPHRANGEIAFHVLDVMESLLAAAASGDSVTVSSGCTRPALVSGGL
jgi:predicted dehydrogenase